jgi:hypothetical protein
MTGFRTYATFAADFADDASFNVARDIERPAGFEIATALVEHLSAAASPVFPPIQHSFYGWAFATKPKGDIGFVIQYVDPWLLICENQGDVGMAEFAGVLHTVHRAIMADSRFSSLRWFTKKEFDSKAAGGLEPT